MGVWWKSGIGWRRVRVRGSSCELRASRSMVKHPGRMLALCVNQSLHVSRAFINSSSAFVFVCECVLVCVSECVCVPASV